MPVGEHPMSALHNAVPCDSYEVLIGEDMLPAGGNHTSCKFHDVPADFNMLS
jgi:hypothetical protein